MSDDEKSHRWCIFGMSFIHSKRAYHVEEKKVNIIDNKRLRPVIWKFRQMLEMQSNKRDNGKYECMT